MPTVIRGNTTATTIIVGEKAADFIRLGDKLNRNEAPAAPARTASRRMKERKMAQKPMPGVAGVEHIGLTVPDIEQATQFFVDLLGCEVIYNGMSYSAEDNWMADHLNVHPRAKIEAIRFLRCGNGSNIELFQYSSPDQKMSLAKTSDPGAFHLAFYVDAIDAAYDYLLARGVRTFGSPTVIDDGPGRGMTWLIFEAPWGTQLELVSHAHPPGMMNTPRDRLWHPRA
jgi:catechol 2,3-dioxygenase-like lactoylglutathione lyase family enzyme